jgi:hypothetical protein
MSQVSWVPTTVDDGYWMPRTPFTTTGVARHTSESAFQGGTYARGLPIARADLDPGIAGLVHALNDAGIVTMGSCEDISDDDENPLPIMIVEFRMQDWPKLAPMIPRDVADNESGWLVTANPAEPEIMAALFPASEYESFLARVKKLTC